MTHSKASSATAFESGPFVGINSPAASCKRRVPYSHSPSAHSAFSNRRGSHHAGHFGVTAKPCFWLAAGPGHDDGRRTGIWWAPDLRLDKVMLPGHATVQ
jgi:hypothetical protein